LDPGNYQFAESVDVGSRSLDDDIVGASHVVGGFDALNGANLLRDMSSFAHFGLDKHECLNHKKLLTVGAVLVGDYTDRG
jgi:hypothetical protein